MTQVFNKFLNFDSSNIPRLKIKELRTVNWFNYSFIFAGGFGMRIIFLTIYILLLNALPDYNDSNELVVYALKHLINGNYPYGQNYHLEALKHSYNQEYFNYTPLTLLFHLPVLIYPHSIGNLDLMPGMLIFHSILDYYMAHRLYNSNFRGSAGAIWLNPFWFVMNFVLLMSLPVLLFCLAYLNIDSPKKTAFYIGIGGLIYLYIFIALPYFLFYHWKHKFKFIIGLFPMFFILGIFLAWGFLINRPTVFFWDIFLFQLTRIPISFLESPYGLGVMSAGSIASLVFSFFKINISIYMMVFAVIFIILSSFHILLYRKEKNLMFFYTCLALSLLAVSSSTGLVHYWALPLVSFAFLLEKRGKINLFNWKYVKPEKTNYKICN